MNYNCLQSGCLVPNIEIVLASGSPRRRELLQGLGLRLIIDIPGIPENALPSELPEEHVIRLAKEKARSIAPKYAEKIVLAADTAVVIDNHILGKPVDKEDARRMLRIISNRWHTVYTGYCLIDTSTYREKSNVVSSQVFMRKLNGDQIDWYIDTGEPLDKAGAYAIQGIGAALVMNVKGSYTNVVGLPLAEVLFDIERMANEENREHR